jgi:predicted RNA-binding Zn-ribbon protein involved in translation (DUF1610 family)
MGGHWSGRWHGHNRRQTVESAVPLTLGADGRLMASLPPGFTVRVDRGARAFLCLLDGGGAVAERIEILSQAMPQGGTKHFFACPVCGKPARTLYSPTMSPFYACRKCHGLTYESVRAAHDLDRNSVTRAIIALHARKDCPAKFLLSMLNATRRGQRRECRQRHETAFNLEEL